MAEIKQTRQQLEKRRDEIQAQLREVNQDERINLDNDLEQQAIQMEQHEVWVTMEQNLQKELTYIEEQLAEIEENGE